MHWLGPYVIKHITDGGVVQLAKLNGELIQGKSKWQQVEFVHGQSYPYSFALKKKGENSQCHMQLKVGTGL